MSYIRLANFFDLYDVRRDGSLSFEARYSNAEPGRALSYNGTSYPYLSFIYQGAAKNRTGDNLQAAILLSTNKISTNLARKAVNQRWHVEIYSAVLSPNGSVSRVLTIENWMVASMSYDPEAVEVVLSSGIDAVGANAPTRTLTRAVVGALPVTGNIRAQ